MDLPARLRGLRSTTVDLWLAVALTAAGQVETWANAEGRPTAGSVAGALLMTAPVATRRVHPVGSLTVAYTSVALQGASAVTTSSACRR